MTDKHEIILIWVDGTEECYDCLRKSPIFLESVGKWDTVTTEELQLLRNNRYSHNYRVVERNPSLPLKPEIKTPQEYLALIREENEKAKKQIARRQKEDDAKKRERKRKQFEKLKKELEDFSPAEAFSSGSIAGDATDL